MRTEKAILVIENDPEMAQRIEDTLRPEGYLIFTASTEDIAISIAEELSPSLILVSLTMPDGLETCKKIKDIESLRDTPIIALTSPEQTSVPQYGVLYGIVDYLEKPFSPEELISKTETALGIKEIKEDFIPIEEEVEGLIEKSFEPSEELPIQKERIRLFIPIIIGVVLVISGMIYLIMRDSEKAPTATPQGTARIEPQQPLEEKASEPEMTAETQKATAEPERPFYSAQAGAFKTVGNAEALVEGLKSKGYDAFVHSITIDNQKLHKVLVGKFEDKKKAKEIVSTLKDKEDIKAMLFSSE